MRPTRITFIAMTLAIWGLNGAGLASGAEGLAAAALVFGMIATPVLVYVAYRMGEIASEDLRQRHSTAR